MSGKNNITVPHILIYGKSYYLGTDICPRCGIKGKKKVVTTKQSNPQPYMYFTHYSYEKAYPNGKYEGSCYIGKVINGHVRCITSGEIVSV